MERPSEISFIKVEVAEHMEEDKENSQTASSAEDERSEGALAFAGITIPSIQSNRRQSINEYTYRSWYLHICCTR